MKQREVTKSVVDPDAGLFYKNERERMFCYSMNVACDRHGFVLGMHVSAGNIHDSVNFMPIFNRIKESFPQMKAVTVDAGYVTPYIAKLCFDQGVIPVLPYKRPMTKKGFFRKHEYVYDEFYDQYICPNNEVLSFSTIDRDGYRIYRSNPSVCKDCPMLNQCTHSRNHQKVITRHVWAEYLEEANHLRHTSFNKRLYPLRSQTIERVFADFKEKHGMRYTQYRGLNRVRDEAMLAFACMNMKKIANWKWKGVA